jgi:hypothetical protein
MKTPWSLLALMVLLILLSTDVEAARPVRDFSGDAMQSYNSRMLDSPMLRIPTLLGTTFWPFLPYPPAPTMMFVDIQIQMPELYPPPPSPPSPPAHAKFWTARCGIFVEFDVGSTMNLMEEEQKPCRP